MLSKTFIGFVVVFWAVMMTALVRMEIYPNQHRELVPVSEVVDKVFHSNLPVSMDVIYHGTQMGRLRMDVDPITASGRNAVGVAALHPGAYRLSGIIRLQMVVFGTPTPMQIQLESAVLDSKYSIKNYVIHTRLGDSKTDIKGDNDDRVLDLSYGIGLERQSKHLAYEDLEGRDVFSALNMNDLPGLPALGGGGLLGNGSSASMAKDLLARLDVQAYRAELKTPHDDTPHAAMVVEIRTDQSLNLWAKIWVDSQGVVQLVETSMGLTLRSNLYDNDGGPVVNREFERGPRRHHDPH